GMCPAATRSPEPTLPTPCSPPSTIPPPSTSRSGSRTDLSPPTASAAAMAVAAARAAPALANDDVVDRGDHRLARVDAGLGEDRHQRLAERLERLGRVPDVEDLQPVLAFERGVVAA